MEPKNTNKIKKTVGKIIQEHPLERAYKLHIMLEELRGKQLRSTENVKKEVGAKK